MTNHNDGGYDEPTIGLVIHEPPASLVALRQELAYHPDITEYAQHGATFEDCLGRIALKLDIALDGMYDVPPLCAILVEALRSRRFHGNQPYLRAKGLVDAEIVETADGITLQKRDNSVVTILPKDAVVVQNDTSKIVSPTAAAAAAAAAAATREIDTGGTSSDSGRRRTDMEAAHGSNSDERANSSFNFHGQDAPGTDNEDGDRNEKS